MSYKDLNKEKLEIIGEYLYRHTYAYSHVKTLIYTDLIFHLKDELILRQSELRTFEIKQKIIDDEGYVDNYTENVNSLFKETIVRIREEVEQRKETISKLMSVLQINSSSKVVSSFPANSIEHIYEIDLAFDLIKENNSSIQQTLIEKLIALIVGYNISLLKEQAVKANENINFYEKHLKDYYYHTNEEKPLYTKEDISYDITDISGESKKRNKYTGQLNDQEVKELNEFKREVKEKGLDPSKVFFRNKTEHTLKGLLFWYDISDFRNNQDNYSPDDIITLKTAIESRIERAKGEKSIVLDEIHFYSNLLIDFESNKELWSKKWSHIVVKKVLTNDDLY